MRKRVLLIVVSCALLGFAPAPFPKPERQRQEPDDVSGLWHYVRSETNGRHDEQDVVNYRMEITRESFVFVQNKTNVRTAYVMRLDPAASPPSFTWSRSNQVMYVGSYRLQKDQLTMIFINGNNVEQRPTDFGSAPMWRYVLRRVGRR
jgi:uncharacterized protein (TIGR03067 family)